MIPILLTTGQSVRFHEEAASFLLQVTHVANRTVGLVVVTADRFDAIELSEMMDESVEPALSIQSGDVRDGQVLTVWNWTTNMYHTLTVKTVGPIVCLEVKAGPNSRFFLELSEYSS